MFWECNFLTGRCLLLVLDTLVQEFLPVNTSCSFPNQTAGGAVWTLRLPFPPPLPLHTENNSMMPSKYSFFSSLWFEITHPVLNWKLPVRNVNPTPYLCMPNFLRPSTKKIQKLCQIEFHFINSKNHSAL